MSADALTEYFAYMECALAAGSFSVIRQRRLSDLAAQLRMWAAARLAPDTFFARLVCPMRDTAVPDDLYSVDDGAGLYVDVLGPDGEQDVVTAHELRSLCMGMVRCGQVRLWFINDAVTGVGRYVLRYDRTPGAYRLRFLYVRRESMLDRSERGASVQHSVEALLLTVMSRADRNRAAVHTSPTPAPMIRLLYAAMGFMRDATGDLVRPPTDEMVLSPEILGVIDRQITDHWVAHTSALPTLSLPPVILDTGSVELEALPLSNRNSIQCLQECRKRSAVGQKKEGSVCRTKHQRT